MSPDGAPGGAGGAPERGRRRRAVGQVVSDRMQKTIRVQVDRLLRHPRYKKYIRRSTVCFAHDERGQAHLGDTVEIVETRPLSKRKRWRLVRVVERAVGSEEEPGAQEAAP
jgi:small subunit ribosomal protein S17